jgi:ABC-type multidrug transport system fused ATPase/permease subunit
LKNVKTISGTWSKLAVILNKSHKKLYALMVGLGMLSAILEILGISLLLHTILSILKPEFIQHNLFTSFIYNELGLTDNRTFLLAISLLLFVIYVTKNIILVQVNKLQVRYAFRITDDLSGKHYRRVARKELLYFKNNKSAQVINELLATTLAFPEGILLSSIILLSELFIVIIMLGAILIYKPFLFVFTFLTVFPVAAILVFYNRKRLSKKGAKVHQIFPQVFENISELTNGISNIKLWDGMDYFEKRYTDLKRETYQLKESIYVSSQFIPIRIYEVIAISGILCVVFYGVLGHQSISSVVSYISIYAGVSFRLLPSVNRIIATANTLSTNEYIIDYLIENNEDDKNISSDIKQLIFETNLELKDIDFSYSDGDKIFESLNLIIEKGSFVGIIGSSGVGKSTLVNILASLIEPSAGDLLVDGKSLNKKDLRNYRYLFSYVKQDVFMLNTTILENVAFLDENPDLVKAKKCLEMVNLIGWIKSLDKEWDTPVGELGAQISGGQRQRIAIARALYKDSEVFIFDEVTNNLDTYSKEQTLAAIASLKEQGKTAIFITHKEDELKLCDSIYSLSNGKLNEVE